MRKLSRNADGEYPSGGRSALNLQGYAKVLRARWITICVTALLALVDALAFTLTTTPGYQASTRLFVSAGSSIGRIWNKAREAV